MQKMFCGVLVLLVVSLGSFVSCKKTEPSTSVSATAKQETKSQEPIIVGDMADFEFTSGWNVPGTLFQSDFKWDRQDGQTVALNGTGTQYSIYSLKGVPRRFDFSKGDIVTVVFKVQNVQYPAKNIFDFVSIEKK